MSTEFYELTDDTKSENENLQTDLDKLINEAKGGDQGAFSCLCEKYEGLIQGTVSSFSDKISEEFFSRDDLYQENLMAFYRAVMTYETGNGGVTFGLYAKICMRNAMISLVRKVVSAKRKQKKAPLQQIKRNDDVLSVVADANLNGITLDKIYSILTVLEANVLSCHIKNMSYADIAAELSVSTKTVDNALYRIRKKIKKADIFKN